MEGQAVKIPTTVTEESPTAYAFKLEAGMGNPPMMVVEKGRATKQK